MTFTLQRLVQLASDEARRNPCADGEHDWSTEGEGGRPCPTGCDRCSQTVYKCRTCGAYDYGIGEDSPGLTDCKAVCGDSLTGWRGGHLDSDHDDQPCRDCADLAVDGVCPNSGMRCGE